MNVNVLRLKSSCQINNASKLWQIPLIFCDDDVIKYNLVDESMADLSKNPKISALIPAYYHKLGSFSEYSLSKKFNL